MIKTLFFIFLLFSNNVLAWDNWSEEKQNWFVASNVAIAADWLLTRDATERWDEGYKEKNPILGSHPNKGELNTYMLGRVIVNYLLAEHLPEDVDMFYLKMSTVAHGAAAVNNYAIGLRFNF